MSWQVILFAAGLGLIAFALGLHPVLRSQWVDHSTEILEKAQAAIASGDIAKGTELAQQAVLAARRSHRSLGPCLLALGLAREQQAEQLDGGDRLLYYAAAAQHFGEAARAGVSSEDQLNVTFHLGKCLYARGQIAESIPLLGRSAEACTTDRADALWLLTLAYLDPSELDLRRALTACSKLIAISGLSTEQLFRAWETRSEILTRLGQPDHLAGLDPCDFRSDPRWLALLVGAQECCGNKQYEQAIALYQELLTFRGLPLAIQRRAQYLLGAAAAVQGDFETALSTFGGIEGRFPESGEARAAAAQSGAILLSQGKVGPSVAAFDRAVRQPSSDDPPRPAVLDTPPLDRLIRAALEQLRKQREFEAAAALVQCYRTQVPAVLGDQLAAELHDEWGHALRQQDSLDAVGSQPPRCRAEERFRMAGTLYGRVADAAPTAYLAAHSLWKAAHSFVQCQDYHDAMVALERLLATEAANDIRPDALALASTVSQACNRPLLSVRYAESCIREFPKHPAAATARYQLARCQVASGAMEPAEATLRANLTSAACDSNRAITEQTRLLLAKLLHQEGRHTEAIPQLHEILASTTEHATTIESRLLLADCLRCRARQRAERLEQARGGPERSHYRQRRTEDLEQAIQLLDSLEGELIAFENSRRALVNERTALRQCRWAIAECLYELDRYEEAITAYETLAQLYSEPADWIEAQIQIANCHGRMNRLDAARSVLESARNRIGQLPPEALEEARLGMSQTRWQEWLDWIDRL